MQLYGQHSETTLLILIVQLSHEDCNSCCVVVPSRKDDYDLLSTTPCCDYLVHSNPSAMTILSYNTMYGAGGSVAAAIAALADG